MKDEMAERAPSRIELQPVAPDDVDQLLEIFREPAVRRYLLDDQIVDVDWVNSEIAASERRFSTTGAGLWAVRLVASPAVVGFAGFREFFDPPQLQLLYGLRPEFCGRGLATEAAARVCAYGFETLGFSEIRAATDAPNVASMRVLERLGMTQVPAAGAAQGTVFFVLSRGVWLSRMRRDETR